MIEPMAATGPTHTPDVGAGGSRADGTARSSGTVEQSVHYVDRGVGRAVVLIHGIGVSSRFWDSTVETLVRSRRVVAVDLPGFGHSPAARGLVEYLHLLRFRRCADA